MLTTPNATPSSRRSRKTRRRVSSGHLQTSVSPPKSLASAPSPVRNASSPLMRSRGFVLPQKLHLTDGSDYDDYRQPLTDILNRGRSTSPARRKIFEERPPPTAYASLPPTPILQTRPISPPTPVSPLRPAFQDPSPSTTQPHPSQPPQDDTPFSLWDYLREELLATDFDSHQELKWERVSNFLQIPWAMEKVWFYVLLVKLTTEPN